MTLWTVACQAPLSMGFSWQDYWSGLPFPSSGDLPHPGIKLSSLPSLALASGFFTTHDTLAIALPPSACKYHKNRSVYYISRSQFFKSAPVPNVPPACSAAQTGGGVFPPLGEWVLFHHFSLKHLCLDCTPHHASSTRPFLWSFSPSWGVFRGSFLECGRVDSSAHQHVKIHLQAER